MLGYLAIQIQSQDRAVFWPSISQTSLFHGTHGKWYYNWYLNNSVVKGTALLQTKNLHIIYCQPSIYTVSHQKLQPTGNPAVLSCSSLKKKLYISGPAQFQSVFFKGQLEPQVKERGLEPGEVCITLSSPQLGERINIPSHVTDQNV